MNHSKKWSICFLAVSLILLLGAASLTAAVDPFFHFHAPAEDLEYPINNQRYQNDGIVKNFTYDALITGTSLAENFKASEFDELFGVNSVKVTFSGGTYEEITSNLHRAMQANPGIRYVIYAMDEWFLFAGKDLILADGEYPTYLYDDDIFNDANYLLNKEILCSNTLEVLNYTAQGMVTTSFDDYSSWNSEHGPEVVLASYNRSEKLDSIMEFTEDQAALLAANLRKNLVELANEHPDTQFLYFFPPYSILNWDNQNQIGILEQQVKALKLATEVLLEADNIQVYSFYTDYETITDLNNYSDIVHYSSEINSLLLNRMYRGEYRLTKENYEAHWQEVLDHYLAYDYDAFFQ